MSPKPQGSIKFTVHGREAVATRLKSMVFGRKSELQRRWSAKMGGEVADLELGKKMVDDSNPGMVYEITEPKFDFSECYSIVGSCNGLFCSASYHVDDVPIQLCNPSIRWTTRVPPFRFNNKIIHPDVFRYCYGVGFDGLKCDYKVVKFIGPDCDISRHGKAAIYSVKAKSWKIVKAPVPPYLFCGYYRHSFCKVLFIGLLI
ncbi:hypothetical protein BUALT_Bualt07G0105200 [Buddleja alternifolia]|uniref:F-box associated beta-propeller type 1 domain-containing protein n=1 Tax=Buddleja alternifolia TaxID=168488 RepID=A0AAV6XE67_9LAMI|nr:hypothetical protein BUALT_Bualt07G0105200 [Buddleja alternifolia]